MNEGKIQEQLRSMRTLIQEMGWADFMRELGGILAEQADKTSGDQSGALLACHNTFAAIHDAFVACGRFTYPKEMVDCDGSN